MTPSDPCLILGHPVWFDGDPFDDPLTALRDEPDGAVLVQGGRIAAVGPAARLRADHPQVTVIDHAGHILMAGFVDTHVHYPQTHIIASYGAQLLDWLERYTFPAEAAFADPAHARAVAAFFLDEMLANGTTSASVFCTVHPGSVDAFFTEAAARDLRVAAGKVLMDHGVPDDLRDDAQSAYDDSAALIARWHGRGRAHYAITPRFALTSSPEQLAAAGALWAAHPDVLMQTHLSENHAEIAAVAARFADQPDYLGVYEHHGLLGPGANFGHGIHLRPREIARLAQSGAAIAHCPTSNLFIGSGLFDLDGLRRHGVRIGLGSDVGGGSSLSMLVTMRAAYEVAQLRGVSLHPAQAFWLATVGGATTLRMDTQIGNLRPGMEADLIALDPAATKLLAARTARASSLADVLFALMILGDERAVAGTYVRGRRVGG